LALFVSADADWEQISDEDGIKVWQRSVAGSSVVEFRGRTILDENIIDVAAVVRNDDQKTKWLKNCIVNDPIEFNSALDEIVYNRARSPVFFISDRDTVAEVKTSVVPGERAIRIDIEGIVDARVPDVEGVVRLPMVAGFWKLVELDRKRTEVTYQLQADPGG